MKIVRETVESYKNLILEAERYIWANPETGFKETKTSSYLAEKFRELGYEITLADTIPGFYTVVDTGRPGPEILVLGELDSIICRAHPESDKTTGAVHSCGHNAQCAALLGVAAALKNEKILDALSGRIRLCAVPAEELLEIEYRSELRREGKIKYFGGKSEFLSRGYFDGVDMAFMVHTSYNFTTIPGGVGCIAKNVIYKGKAAHAGGSPWDGKNALYAASCGLNAVNAIRETFKERDLIRVHPIITDGGSMVNAIPEEVRIESYVRGKTNKAIDEANEKVNRALIGSAYSLGTNIEIIDAPGYSPLVNEKNLLALAKEALHLALPEEELNDSSEFSTGSTDMGDLSMIMPVIHPYAGGAVGTSHGKDYYIRDPERACVKSAVWQVALLKMLLENGAVRAKEIIANFKPEFNSKEEFLAYQDSKWTSGDRIVYREAGAEII
ncbi:MAG: amidohydrolase [Clostridia bacterium]|nr:amidohydrolase [Clostridia bacterium]